MTEMYFQNVNRSQVFHLLYTIQHFFTNLTWISCIFFTFLLFSANLNVICARIHKPMAKKRFRITEKDFLLANRKASREEEIAKYGKQIMFRSTTRKSKKVYDRKHLKKAGINSDDLPLMIIASHACTYSSNVYVSIYGPTASIMRKIA